jgi:cellulose synthase/poly-beta-1,6-N-acetylglucosamine synthase-like glycosyltransferase
LLILIEFLLGGAALLLLLPVTILFVEVLLGVAFHTTKDLMPVGERLPLAVVMPAHNEVLVITKAIRTILPQLVKTDRLLVVADNCSDDTAAIAAAEGAEVIERHDLSLRGKGYALDFGIRHLERDPPRVVIIIDADCQVAAGSIDRLSRLCSLSQRPIQALYLMHAGEGAGLNTRIAEFAWVVKNQVRPLGLNHVGLPCQLMGTGMAFPWVKIAAAELATGHIVEDLKLGIAMARAGAPALFCPEALVTSCFPASAKGAQGQRARWEHGHMSVILSDAPGLFLESFKSSNVNLMILGLDLCVPPLALLSLVVIANCLATICFLAIANVQFPFVVMMIEVMLIGLSVLMSWVRYGRRIISFGSLAFALIYALLKIPLYVKFFVARQTHWVRSKRDGD